ncbi:hypothetical protein K0M31_010846 [Melipona bicolor]|uniref:Uncharacterized protein n=1 Tax=Melipona bicolor TaxID=60889 RepID=A0AA40KI01_9HYME|nr:hypothetical protein K0M31_010846 [Melipona bicolor]
MAVRETDYICGFRNRKTRDTRSGEKRGSDPRSRHFTTYLCICPTDRSFPEARKRAKHTRPTISVRRLASSRILRGHSERRARVECLEPRFTRGFPVPGRKKIENARF